MSDSPDNEAGAGASDGTRTDASNGDGAGDEAGARDEAGAGDTARARLEWRGSFTSAEANLLHAEAFETRVFSDEEWDWVGLTAAHSLGWVTARDAEGRLVGFVNVVWDGLVHAWLQDVMVASSHRRSGVGRAVVAAAADGARRAGCEWLHVDFDEEHRAFYIDACGFTPAPAGLLHLA